MQDTTPSLSPSDIVLNPAILPRNSTTFFSNWPHAKPLPTPAQIRSSTFDSTFQILHHRKHGSYAQRVLHIPDLGLVIKHGPRTTIAEGQTLWAVGKYCPQVRVPMVYGWSQDGDETFIYLSYIDGVSLDSRLNTLSDTELKDIAFHVAPMIASIRHLRQPRQDTFVGELRCLMPDIHTSHIRTQVLQIVAPFVIKCGGADIKAFQPPHSSRSRHSTTHSLR